MPCLDKFLQNNNFVTYICKKERKVLAISVINRKSTNGSSPGHALHEKGLQKTNRRRYTGQQPGTKSALRPADQLVVNQ